MTNRFPPEYWESNDLPTYEEAILHYPPGTRERDQEISERMKAGDPDPFRKTDLGKAFDPAQPRDDQGKWTTGFNMPWQAFDEYDPDADFSDAMGTVVKEHEHLYKRSIQGEPYDGDQIDAVKRYTNEDYAEINRTLRSGGEFEQGYLQERVEAMDALFDQASLAEDVVAYRWVDTPTMNELDRAKAVVDRGFVSTSSSPYMGVNVGDNPVGGDHIIAIQLPKGSKALPVAHLAASALEREVLIARGQTFDVVAGAEAAFPRSAGVDLVLRLRT